MSKSGTISLCHPPKPAHARGVCKSCYDRQYHKDHPDRLRTGSDAKAKRHQEALERAEWRAEDAILSRRAQILEVIMEETTRGRSMYRGQGIWRTN